MAKWYVKDNGGKGELVGIASEDSKWFIAEEVTKRNAELICELHNNQWIESKDKLPDELKTVIVYSEETREQYMAFRKAVYQGGFVEWFILMPGMNRFFKMNSPASYCGYQFKYWKNKPNDPLISNTNPSY
jgi:hypothetical protein